MTQEASLNQQNSRPTFGSIETIPAYMKVATAIENEILKGRFVPGDRIGTETNLATQFGVHRSTVREGIRYLEQSGLLRRNQSRRLVVSLPRYSGLATRVNRALVLHKTTFQEVWEAAMVIDSAVAEMAAKRVEPDELALLDTNIEESEKEIDDPDRVVELDTGFHSLLAKCAKNRVLQLSRESSSLLYGPVLRVILEEVPPAAHRNLDSHKMIVNALHNGDAAEAKRWMQKHLNDWRRGFAIMGKDLNDPITLSID